MVINVGQQEPEMVSLDQEKDQEKDQDIFQNFEFSYSGCTDFLRQQGPPSKGSSDTLPATRFCETHFARGPGS